jgi:hypothetical protein
MNRKYSTFDGCQQLHFSGPPSHNEPLAQYIIKGNISAESVSCCTVSVVLDACNMVERFYVINKAIIMLCS